MPLRFRSMGLPLAAAAGLFTIAASIAVVFACSGRTEGLACSEPTPSTTKPVIAVVLSYDSSYEWQRQITAGIQETIGERADLLFHEMDTLGVQEEADLQNRGQAALRWLEETNAAAVIIADDAAMRYVAEAGRSQLDIPIVLCGVNWPASDYDLPRAGISGMVEVSPVGVLLRRLSTSFEPGDAIFLLGANRQTDQAQASDFVRSATANGLRPTVQLVNNFDEWQDAFITAQSSSALVYLLNNAGIPGWDDAKALELTQRHTTTLTASEYAWMRPYVVLSALKRGEEQGAWAAGDAWLRVTQDNHPPGPIVTNREVSYEVNDALTHNVQRDIPMAIRMLAGSPE